MGVVDASLNVYGVHVLKLADLSIAPDNVAANTMNTALLIGEKAADIIIQELVSGAKDSKTDGGNGTKAHGVNGTKPNGVNGIH